MITDFGLSRMIACSQTMLKTTSYQSSVKGSARWMANELIQTESSDSSMDSERSSGVLLDTADDLHGIPVHMPGMAGSDSTARIIPMDSVEEEPITPSERYLPGVSNSLPYAEMEASEAGEELDSVHTKESDMWSFGMVIYIYVLLSSIPIIDE